MVIEGTLYNAEILAYSFDVVFVRQRFAVQIARKLLPIDRNVTANGRYAFFFVAKTAKILRKNLSEIQSSRTPNLLR